jgi:hypothetical protein
MAEQAAKAKRLTAEVKLKAKAKSLVDACGREGEDAPSEQVVERKLRALEGAWADLESAHHALMEVLDATTTAAEEQHFAALHEIYFKGTEVAEALCDRRHTPAIDPNPPVATLAQRLQIAVALRDSCTTEAEEIFSNVYDYFQNKERTESRGTLGVQTEALDRAKEAAAKANTHTMEMVQLDPERAADAVRKQKEFTLGEEKKATELRSIIATMIASLAPSAATEPPAHQGGPRNYMYERRPLPKFGGQRRDFPSFRREWRESVTGCFTPEYELRELKRCVPAAVEPDVKNLRSVDAVWAVLNSRYGRVMELAKELVGGLQKFTYSKQAKTDSARFAELHREWTKVYNDLEEVDKLSTLDHEPTLSNIATSLPGDGPKMEYVKLRLAMLKEGEQGSTSHSELDIMRRFMKEEWDRQDYFAQLLGGDEAKSTPRREEACGRCGENGHRASDCPSTRKFYGSSHANMNTTPRTCPACQGTHTIIGSRGDTLYRTRLGACHEFRSLSLSDRAALVERVGGCALCLDFTGEHKRDACTALYRGAPMSKCDIESGGVQCGQKHNSLLHGSTTRFCNMTQGSRDMVHVNCAKDKGAPTLKDLEADEAGCALMQVQKVEVDAEVSECLVFWDSGSNISLVTSEFAERAGLLGIPARINLATAGRRADAKDTTAYWVPLVDLTGAQHGVLAYEMESITDSIREVDVRAAMELFPDIVDYEAIRRPSGPVDLLVGIQESGMFPYPAHVARHKAGNLQLLASAFGTGFLLAGEHPNITAGRVMQTRESLSMSQAAASNGAYGSAGMSKAGIRICNRVTRPPVPAAAARGAASTGQAPGLSRTPWARARQERRKLDYNEVRRPAASEPAPLWRPWEGPATSGIARRGTSSRDTSKDKQAASVEAGKLNIIYPAGQQNFASLLQLYLGRRAGAEVTLGGAARCERHLVLLPLEAEQEGVAGWLKEVDVAAARGEALLAVVEERGQWRSTDPWLQEVETGGSVLWVHDYQEACVNRMVEKLKYVKEEKRRARARAVSARWACARGCEDKVATGPAAAASGPVPSKQFVKFKTEECGKAEEVGAEECAGLEPCAWRACFEARGAQCDYGGRDCGVLRPEYKPKAKLDGRAYDELEG